MYAWARAGYVCVGMCMGIRLLVYSAVCVNAYASANVDANVCVFDRAWRGRTRSGGCRGMLCMCV